MCGRPLHLTDPNQTIEGETTDIFVSRMNIFRDGMDELLGGSECVQVFHWKLHLPESALKILVDRVKNFVEQ